MTDEQHPQVEPRQAGVPDNTEAQLAFLKANEEFAEEERTWPFWDVEITGEQVLWAARPGVNIAEKTERVELKIGDTVVFNQTIAEGDPAPYVEVARATVTCQARNEQMAQVRALGANPEYHTVESIRKVKK